MQTTYCSGWGSVKVNEGEFVSELKRKTAFHPEESHWLVIVYRDESWSGSDLGSGEVITLTLKCCGYTVSGRITCICDTGSGSYVTRRCITVTTHIRNKTEQKRFRMFLFIKIKLRSPVLPFHIMS